MVRYPVRFALLVLAACAAGIPAPSPAQEVEPVALVEVPRAASTPLPGVRIELVESVPVETKMNRTDIRNAADVWVEMIEGADSTLDIAQMYVSNTKEGGLLEPVIRPASGTLLALLAYLAICLGWLRGRC